MVTLDDTQLYLPELWATHAKSFANKPAIICGERQISWREFNTSLNRVANALLRDGVAPSQKVAIIMGNSVETLFAMYGCAKARACIVPISTLLTPQQVATLLEDSEAETVFASANTLALVTQAESLLMQLEVKRRIVVGDAADHWISFEQWIADASEAEPPVRYELSDDFNIIYSSGTTGLPKGIVQTHRARQHWSYSNALELRFDCNSIALVTTSLYSNGTWFMLLPPLFVGATIVILEQFSPENFLSTVEREQVTHTFMVPTQFITTLAYEHFSKYDITSLRVMLSAGSPLRSDTRAAVLERMGKGLFELYGCSEGFATIIRPEQANKIGSVGTPVIGFDIAILDEAGNCLGPDEVGEIAGYGAGLMRGYHRQADLTAELIWQDERGRTFIRSGDIGRLDSDGFLYLLDRKKDMILSGGFNVFPKDIEEVVGAHPDVQDVAVIAVPHEKWGETPLALVIPNPGTQVDTVALLEWANSRLSKTQRLSAVELRSEFPRNALGKVLKRHLRDPYWTHT